MATQAIESGATATSLPIWQERNFQWLWVGEFVSMLGDQFAFIAMPWLVLQLTGDPLAVGMVLAAAGVPRLIFMLVGGVATDRFSPRMVMILSNIARLILMAGLASVVLSGMVQLWMLYSFAVLFGVADAFFYPAQSAIVPHMVAPEQLQTANAFAQSNEQITLFVGPALAGLLIALVGGEVAAGVPNFLGIGSAFGFTAVAFLLSAAMLAMIRMPARTVARDTSDGVLAAIRSGIAHVWQDRLVRMVFLLITAVNVLVTAPLNVGIPVIADLRLAEGAAAFGLIMSSFGGGSLLGIVLAGWLPAPPTRRLLLVLLLVWSLEGIGTAALGFTSVTWAAAGITGLMGLGNGYTVVLFMTWLQQRTPEALLGRVMSLLMIALFGLAPVGNALAGALIKLNLTGYFVGSGLLMTAIVWLSLLQPELRDMSAAPSD